MKILIGYTSIEGQTRKIAETVADRIEAGSDKAALFDIASMAEYALERPQAVILCAPVHIGRYPQAFEEFVSREKDWLHSVPGAFISVSLSILSEKEEEREEAKAYPDALIAATGWKPEMIHHAAGALRYTEYDFFKRWMMTRIAAKTGGSAITEGSRDREFTDWDDLGTFIDTFVNDARDELAS